MKNINIRFTQALLPVLNAIKQKGGKPFFVGGCVRDALLNIPCKDIDIEVHSIAVETLKGILSSFGVLTECGESFGILKVKLFADKEQMEFDFSVPRTEEKVGEKHTDFKVNLDPEMGLLEATLRRDLTINALMWCPFTKQVIDLHGGIEDLQKGIARFVNRETFADDPLRVLRIMQMCSRFGLECEDDTLALCIELAPKACTIASERIAEEFAKIFKGKALIIKALRFLSKSDWSVSLGFINLHKLFSTMKCKESLQFIQMASNKLAVLLALIAKQDVNLIKFGFDKKTARFVKKAQELFLLNESEAFKVAKMSKEFQEDFLIAQALETMLFVKEEQMFQGSLKSLEPLVSGEDLKQMGLKPDNTFGQKLDTLLRLQVNKGLSKEELMAEAQKFIE